MNKVIKQLNEVTLEDDSYDGYFYVVINNISTGFFKCESFKSLAAAEARFNQYC